MDSNQPPVSALAYFVRELRGEAAFRRQFEPTISIMADKAATLIEQQAADAAHLRELRDSDSKVYNELAEKCDEQAQRIAALEEERDVLQLAARAEANRADAAEARCEAERIARRQHEQ